MVIFFIVNCSNNYSSEHLLGTWQGNYFDQQMTIVFNENTFEMTIKDIGLNKLEKFDGLYSADFNKKPIPLSFTNISNLDHPLHAIMSFHEYDKIVVSEFSPNWRLRRISFEDSENDFTFKRTVKTKNKE